MSFAATAETALARYTALGREALQQLRAGQLGEALATLKQRKAVFYNWRALSFMVDGAEGGADAELEGLNRELAEALEDCQRSRRKEWQQVQREAARIRRFRSHSPPERRFERSI